MDVSGQLHSPASLPTGKELLVLTGEGTQSWSGCGGEDKKILSPAWNQTPVILPMA